MQKLYCYVDESGQDTGGKSFWVSVIIVLQKNRDTLELLLEDVEKKVGKKKLKWKSTHYKIKEEYLKEILKIRILRGNIFYSFCSGYFDQKNYTAMTASAIICSLNIKMRGNTYQVNTYIDGLNDKENRIISRTLREGDIPLKKCRGLRDESSSILRLADAIAGFVRDCFDKQKYTKSLQKQMKIYRLLREA